MSQSLAGNSLVELIFGYCNEECPAHRESEDAPLKRVYEVLDEAHSRGEILHSMVECRGSREAEDGRAVTGQCVLPFVDPEDANRVHRTCTRTSHPIPQFHFIGSGPKWCPTKTDHLGRFTPGSEDWVECPSSECTPDYGGADWSLEGPTAEHEYECGVDGGGPECVFPWRLRETGRTYEGCAVTGNRAAAWCPTATDDEGYFDYGGDQWGYCRNYCPIDEGTLPLVQLTNKGNQSVGMNWVFITLSVVGSVRINVCH